MQTIIFYVKHLSMLRNWVDPVAPFLTDSGLEIVILHASDLNSDTSQSSTPASCPYKTIDVSGMGMRSITRAIRELEPAAILMFTFRSLFDLLLMRLATRCGVRTIYVQHGFYVSTKFTMADKKTSIRRYYHFTRWYLSFLCNEGRTHLWEELVIAWRAIFRVDYHSSGFDYGIFYSPAGLRDASRFFDYPKNRTFFSGYPIADSTSDLEEIIHHSRNAKRKKAIYVHQPFILDKFTHLDHEAEFTFLQRMGSVCSGHGYEFVLKIHPRESVTRYESALAGTSVSIDSSSSIVDMLKDCEIVIGQFSTALFTGVLLEKPIIVMSYPGLDEVYYSFFESVGIRVQNEEELDELLSDESRYKQRLSHYEEFANSYVGRDNSYEHQAETILEIIRRSPEPPASSYGDT